MASLLKICFTAFFLIWEGSLRVRGAWRRREWRNLGRYALRSLAVLLLLLVVARALA